MFTQFLNGFFPASKSPSINPHAAWLEEMREKGRADAVSPFSPTSPHAPGEGGESILHEFWDALHALREQHVPALRHLETVILALGDRVNVSTITDCLHPAKLALKELQVERDRMRQAARAKRDQCQQALNLFLDRRPHLNRRPQYPESYALHYAWVVFLWAVEGMTNSGFLAVGMDDGYVGGARVSLAISALSIVGSYFAGTWTRKLGWNTRQGRALFGAWACGAGLFHILFGHYREILGLGLSDTALFSHFLQHPWGIAPASALLSLVGFCFSASACRHGYISDDPEEGYGEHDRQLKCAALELERVEQEVRAVVHAWQDEQLAGVQVKLAAGGQALEDVAEQIGHYREGKARLKAAVDQQAHLGREAFAAYHASYQHVRLSSQPAYPTADPETLFNTASLFSDFVIEDSDQEFHAIRARFKAMQAEGQRIQEEIRELFTHALMPAASEEKE